MENDTVKLEQANENQSLGSEKTYTKAQIDEQSRLTRIATEKETTKQILAKLGLKPEDEGKLASIKATYENTLSETEKMNNSVTLLQGETNTLKLKLEEKDFIISALLTKTKSELKDVEKIVKMAKGLKDENTTVEDCIKSVIEMTGLVKFEIPVGSKLVNPDTPAPIPNNPFSKENWNLTEQGKIYRENPEKARQMARDVGTKLNY